MAARFRIVSLISRAPRRPISSLLRPGTIAASDHALTFAWPQVLCDVTDTEPLTRNASFRTLAEQQTSIELEDTIESREPLCYPHASGLMFTRAQSREMASQLKALCDQTVGAASDPIGQGLGRFVAELSHHGPRVLDRSLERASGRLIEVLNQGSGVELWCENRLSAPQTPPLLQHLIGSTKLWTACLPTGSEELGAVLASRVTLVFRGESSGFEASLSLMHVMCSGLRPV